MAALAGGLIENDGAGCGNVQGGNTTGHGNAKKMVAGSAGEAVEAFALASEDDDGVGGPVVGVVVHGAALVEADAPDILLLELFKCAHEVDDSGDAQVLGGTGGSLDGDGAERSRTPLGKEDAIDTSSVGGTKQRPEIMRVFDAIEGEQKTGGLIFAFRGSEQVFERKEFPLTHDGNHALMAGGFGHAGQLVTVLKTHANALRAAKIDDALNFLCSAALLAVTADADMVKTTISCPQSLFYRVQPE